MFKLQSSWKALRLMFIEILFCYIYSKMWTGSCHYPTLANRKLAKKHSAHGAKKQVKLLQKYKYLKRFFSPQIFNIFITHVLVKKKKKSYLSHVHFIIFNYACNPRLSNYSICHQSLSNLWLVTKVALYERTITTSLAFLSWDL